MAAEVRARLVGDEREVDRSGYGIYEDGFCGEGMGKTSGASHRCGRGR